MRQQCVRSLALSNSIEHQVNNPGKYFSEIVHLILTLNEANHPISMPGNIKAKFNQEVRIPYLTKLKIGFLM